VTLGHPLVDAALADQRLGKVELNAFRVLWGQLDFETFREKKSDVLAAEIASQRSHASAALRILVECGYLEEGPRSARGIGTYRLARGTPAPGAGMDRSVVNVRKRRQVRSSL
jgi:hypothetical protein